MASQGNTVPLSPSKDPLTPPISSPLLTKHSPPNIHRIHVEQSKYPYHERRYLDPLEQAIPFFYTTHSFIAMWIILLPIVYVSIINPTTEETMTRTAVYIGLYIYFVIGSIIFPSGPFIRPHPVVWRLIFAVSLLYTFMLIILVIVPPMEARMLLAKIDPTLGKAIVLPLYAEDCSLTYANVMSKMDRFVVAHFMGWFVKGLLIRHRLFLWC